MIESDLANFNTPSYEKKFCLKLLLSRRNLRHIWYSNLGAILKAFFNEINKAPREISMLESYKIH